MKETWVTVERGGDASNYVALGVKDAEAFKQERARQEAAGKSGDDLVNALLEATPENIAAVKRYKNGKLNDGPNGEPAMITNMSGTGYGYKVEHYKGGLLNDPEDGSPAMTICARGPGSENNAAVAKHYKDNKAHDGARGEPSYQVFNDKGKLVSAWRTTEKRASIPLNFIRRKMVQKKFGLTPPQQP